MTRTKRQYCNTKQHPRWRAWTARYDDSATCTVVGVGQATRIGHFLGEFCVYCGAQVLDTVGAGAPDAREYGRLKVLRDGIAVAQEEFEELRRRSAARRTKIHKLRASLT